MGVVTVTPSGVEYLTRTAATSTQRRAPIGPKPGVFCFFIVCVNATLEELAVELCSRSGRGPRVRLWGTSPVSALRLTTPPPLPHPPPRYDSGWSGWARVTGAACELWNGTGTHSIAL